MLKNLKLSTETKPVVAQVGKKDMADVINKFIETCQRQIEIVEIEKKGGELPKTSGGRLERRSYWFKGNLWFVSVTYGGTPIDLDGKGKEVHISAPTAEDAKAFKTVFQCVNTVEAGGSLDDVIKVFNVLIKEAEKNEEFRDAVYAAMKRKADALKAGKAAASANA